jgi:hypothetical protein
MSMVSFANFALIVWRWAAPRLALGIAVAAFSAIAFLAGAGLYTLMRH